MQDEESTNQPDAAHSANRSGPQLSDEALSAGGLARVYAFVRKEESANISANAERAKRARQKAAVAGAGQLNVVVPLAAHRVIKTMAKALQTGDSLPEVLTSLLAAEFRAAHPGVVVRVMSDANARKADEQAKKIAKLRGWRLKVARWIGAA